MPRRPDRLGGRRWRPRGRLDDEAGAMDLVQRHLVVLQVHPGAGRARMSSVGALTHAPPRGNRGASSPGPRTQGSAARPATTAQNAKLVEQSALRGEGVADGDRAGHDPAAQLVGDGDRGLGRPGVGVVGGGGGGHREQSAITPPPPLVRAESWFGSSGGWIVVAGTGARAPVRRRGNRGVVWPVRQRRRGGSPRPSSPAASPARDQAVGVVERSDGVDPDQRAHRPKRGRRLW